MVRRHSRPEGFSKVRSTLEDIPGKQVSLIDDATYNDPKGDLKLRGIEAGNGVSLRIKDADNSRFVTSETKIIIDVDTSAITFPPGLEDDAADLDILIYNAPVTSIGQVLYPLPSNAITVHTVSINGLETTNYSFTLGPPTVAINWVAEGYDVDPSDEVLIMYRATI